MKRILALDIGTANIALAEYSAGAKGALSLQRYGVAPLAAPLDSGNVDTILVPALLDIVREKGIRPGPVAVALPGRIVFPRFAAIPAGGGDERFEQQVRYEIEQNVPFPFDEMVCDRQVLGDTENGDKSVMVVAAKTDQVEEITSAVASAGFHPEVVDVSPIALANALKAATPGDDGCMILLDIGAKTTSLAIIEGERMYNRSIPIGGANITREIAQAFGCSEDEAEAAKIERGYVATGGVAEDEDEVADRISKVCRAVLTRLQAEIARSVNFYRSQQGGSAPARMYLSGGCALLPKIDDFFAESLQVEVGFFNPFDVVAAAPHLDEGALASDGAVIAPTAGLALHMAGQAFFSINLLPPSVVNARAERAKIPVVAAAGVTLALALGLVVAAVDRSSDIVKDELDRVEARTAGLRSFDRKVKAAAEEAEKAKAEADSLKALFAARSAMVTRVNVVKAALLPGMWVEKWADGRVTVRGWRDRVEESVAAVRNAGFDRGTASEIVAERLKANPAVDPAGVGIVDMSKIGRDASVEQFTVEIKFR